MENVEVNPKELVIATEECLFIDKNFERVNVTYLT